MMADENKMTKESQTLHEEQSGEPVKATPEYTPEEVQRLEEAGELPEAENIVDEALTGAMEAAEDAVDAPVVEGFDKAVTAVQEAFESVVDDTSAPHVQDYHDTVTIMGREVTVPGGIYTVVFVALGVFTLIEVLLSELPRGLLTVPLMLSLAFVKALLVVVYYMHLREDSRVFTFALVLPSVVMLVSVLFLLADAGTGY